MKAKKIKRGSPVPTPKTQRRRKAYVCLRVSPSGLKEAVEGNPRILKKYGWTHWIEFPELEP